MAETPLIAVQVGPGAPLEVPPLLPAVVVAVWRTSSRPPVGYEVAGADVALCAGPDGAPAPWVAVDDPVAEVAALAARVGEHRVAAVTLVHVLRAALGGDAGLALESLAYSTLQAGPDFARWRAGAPRTSGAAPAGVPAGGEAEPPVVVGRDGDTLHIELNRPAVHNAYNAAMREALYDALAVAAADPAVTVELSGRGPSYCSGGDLSEFGTAPDPASAHLTRTGRSPARLLQALAARTTVELHGACAGSGIELPAFAAFVRARPGTRIWLPELDMGLIPGAGGTVSLPARIGRARTAWLALSGRPIDEMTALEWGLVDEIVAPAAH